MQEGSSPVDAASLFPWAGSQEEAGQRNREAELVVRAQTGQTAAFDELMKLYRERVWAVIYNLTNNREDASDLTQEVFIKAFRKIGRYNFRSSFYTWLYRIAVNSALNSLRKHKLKRALMLDRLPTQHDDDSYYAGGSVGVPLKKDPSFVLQNELQLQLDRALVRLSTDHRTAVVLAEIEGLPLREVAEILKVSEGTVKSRLHYAKKQLQTYLKPYLKR